MQEASCPACGAKLNFASKSSISAVCEYCRALVIKSNMKLETIGKVADLQDELTVLQIYTGGTYKGRQFTLTGRVQKQYEDGYWSEWCASFNDGSHGWLAEAQGHLAFLVDPETPVQTPDFDTLKAGTTIKIGSTLYTVTDRKQSSVISTQGELPFIMKSGSRIQSVDCKANDGSSAFASVEFDSTGKAYVYVGNLFDMDELALTNLRTLDGW